MVIYSKIGRGGLKAPIPRPHPTCNPTLVPSLRPRNKNLEIARESQKKSAITLSTEGPILPNFANKY